MKILILKPSSLGDVVQALPVLRLLKLANPAHRIYWWISEDLADLLRGDPDLAGLFIFHRRRWALPRHWRELLQTVREMRAQQFDWVVDLQGLARSSFVSWLAHGQLCVGVEDWREGAPGLYDLSVPRPSPSTHAVDWYLAVLKALQVPVHWNFAWLPKRPEAAESVQARWRPEAGHWLALSPGARWRNKRWPVEHFAELAWRLAKSYPALRFAVIGSREDAGMGEAICRQVPGRSLNLAGKTSLPEVVEWLRLSCGLVTNDTGPMHIAAALAKPVVGVFGPTDARRTGPYGQIDQTIRIPLPCAPCMKPHCRWPEPVQCLRGLSPGIVISRVEQLLGPRE